MAIRKPILAVLFLLAACSSGPGTSPDGGPAWIRQPVRSVDAGYVIYVGSGEDRNPDRAKLKAEAEALGDLANECSFAPKGARIEDRYEREDKGVHRVYVKAAVDFASCEEAKGATDPEAIRKLASVPMSEELKRYHDLLADESEEEIEVAGNPEGANPALASTRVIQSEPQFWIARQRIFYQKQVVILAPPAAYPPGAPQTQAVSGSLAGATQQVHTYEVANPQVHTSPKTWSGARVQALQSVRAPRSMQPPHPRAEKQAEPPRRKRRRRQR